MRIRLFAPLLLLIIFISTISCKRNHFKVDASKIKVNIHIKRLETDLFTLDPSEIKKKIPDLELKYNGFLRFFGYVINIGEFSDSTWSDGLVKFCTDKLNNEVYTSTMKVFPEIKSIENAGEQQQVSVSDLTEGIYFIRVESDKRTSIKKFCVVR